MGQVAKSGCPMEKFFTDYSSFDTRPGFHEIIGLVVSLFSARTKTVFFANLCVRSKF